jgi:hypothetical protein
MCSNNAKEFFDHFPTTGAGIKSITQYLCSKDGQRLPIGQMDTKSVLGNSSGLEIVNNFSVKVSSQFIKVTEIQINNRIIKIVDSINFG